MKVPSCVLWSLTKKNNCFLVKQKGARGDQWTHDPLNLTGFHCASQAGFTNDKGLGLTCEQSESKSKKKFRRDFLLKVAHKSINNPKKKGKKNADAFGLAASTQRIKKDVNHTAKVVKGLTFANDKKKSLLLKRLAKLHMANRQNVVMPKK